MSDIPRRPPSDGTPEGLRADEGYLLRESLPREVADRIAAVLDRAVRARASRRRQWQVAAGLAAATVAVAAIVGLLRSPREEAPAPPPVPSPVVSEAPAPTAPPAPPPVARLPQRGVPPAPRPLVPAQPAETPPPPKREPPAVRDEPRVAVVPPPPPPSSAIAVGGGTVAGPSEATQVVRLYVRRTDDPSRDPIAMSLRFRAPAGRPKKENRP